MQSTNNNLSFEEKIRNIRRIDKLVEYLVQVPQKRRTARTVDISHFQPITCNQLFNYNILFRLMETDMTNTTKLLLPEINTSISLPKRETLIVKIKYMPKIETPGAGQPSKL